MAHHHKPNKEVEGNPDTGHGRGLPTRPDEVELEELTEEDRQEVGLPPDPDASAADRDPDAAYEEEWSEVDRELRKGDLHQK